MYKNIEDRVVTILVFTYVVSIMIQQSTGNITPESLVSFLQITLSFVFGKKMAENRGKKVER